MKDEIVSSKEEQRSRQSERMSMPIARAIADQAFARAAGAPLIAGNDVRLLKDARENYPAWLDAIRSARGHIHFESYIIHEDEIGEEFADALLAKARDGVKVRLIYDWMGGFGKTSSKFWNRLRAGGVEVRCFNPPRLDSPLGWVSRDHRKMIAVDNEVGFVTGLCVGKDWVGDSAKHLDPWRDTGVEVRGPAVAAIEQAFAQTWGMTGGAPFKTNESAHDEKRAALTKDAGVALRIVASVPNTAGMFRLDQLVAALARKRLWLTDAYYAGTTPYVQALRAAAKDGVDVRLLVPNGSDIPILKPISRAGYRTLLEAGVRVYEWNGTMLHAKTAVADDRWARVGSTNLNIASWVGNCELDVVVEDKDFARAMGQMYEDDLEHATEVVLDAERKRLSPPPPKNRRAKNRLMSSGSSGSGSAGRAAAGALRIGNAVGAAFTDHRVLEPVEGRIMVTLGLVLLCLAILIAFFPRLLVYPLVIIAFWVSAALLYKGYKLHRTGNKKARLTDQTAPAPKS